jgi:hypothetical protein
MSGFGPSIRGCNEVVSLFDGRVSPPKRYYLEDQVSMEH